MHYYVKSEGLVFNENNKEYELPFYKSDIYLNGQSDYLIQDIANGYRLRMGKIYKTRSKQNFETDCKVILEGALEQVKTTSSNPNDVLEVRPGFIEVSTDHLASIKRSSRHDRTRWEYARFNLDPSYECVVYSDGAKTIIYSRDIVWSSFRPYQTVGYRFDKTSGLFTTKGIGKNSRSIMEHTFRM